MNASGGAAAASTTQNSQLGAAARVTPRSSAKKRAVRSHSGCLTCRARKVKCDERSNGCRNCERLRLDCQQADGTITAPAPTPSSGQSQGEDDSHTEAGQKRKRTYRSCTQCRASKARCSGERPECARCTQRDLSCEYDADASPQWTRAVRTGSISAVSISHRGESQEPEAIENFSHQPFQPPPQLSFSSLPEQSNRISQKPGKPSSNSIPPSRSSSVFPGEGQNDSDSMSWLFRPQLPSRSLVRILVKEYFDNIHPLRSFAFIHRPSFIQRLDESSTDDYGRNALLHIVCALGAKFYALQYADTLTPLSSKSILSAGNEWAKRAQQLLFTDLGNISVQNLMVAVLLHDHELRVGNYASAFMLTGVTTRMAQALQVNLEYSTDIFRNEPGSGPSVCSKEARRRLMWSCYIADALVGSGVDQLVLLNEADIKIQLPCNERNFVLQNPCVTEMLEQGSFLKFIVPEAIPPRVVDNMGIVALYIRLVKVRKEVLSYVKHLDKMRPPWLPDSEFSALDTALKDWYAQLPPSLQFTRAALYTRKESSQLGAFILLQCTYNWTICDLYRISLPKLYRLDLRWEYPEAYLKHLQETMFLQARRCAIILSDASRHGVKTLSDSFLPAVAFDSNRIMLYHITQIYGLDTDEGQLATAEHLPYIRSNIEVLKSMQSIAAMAETLYPLAEEMLNKAGLQPGATGQETPHGTITPDQAASDYHPMATSVYGMARESIRDKHPPENNAASPHNSSLQQSTGSSTPTYYTTTPGGHRHPLPRAGSKLSHVTEQPQNHWHPVPSTSIPSHPTDALLSADPSMSALDAFFTTRFDGTWQPAETASAALHEGSLPPWITPTLPVEKTDIGAIQMDMGYDPWPATADIFSIGGAGNPFGAAAGMKH